MNAIKTYDCDVAVIGGGIAGVSASLAAARQGAKVILVEKQCVLGGLATSGLVTVYLPLCDGKGHQVTYGIAYELFKLSIKYGAQRKYPAAWLSNGTYEERKKQRFEVQYNPIYFSLLLEHLLKEEGVKILYESLVTDTVISGKDIKKLKLETIEGKAEINAKSYVDATGDARLFLLSGDTVRAYDKKNILAAWYYYNDSGKLKLNMLGTVEETDCLDKDRHADKPLSNMHFSGTNNDDVNQFICMSHEQMLKDMIIKRKDIDGFEPAVMPVMPQLRMIRCLKGRKVMRDSENGMMFSDSIGVVADWRRRGYIYEIPFGGLCSNSLTNLYAAGRCISVDDEMWEIMRVIPACAVTGEGAGIAAAIKARDGYVKIDELQKQLRNQGQKIHISDIAL